MKLVIDGMSAARAEVYQRAFRWLVEKFKIGHKDATVHLEMFYRSPRHEFGFRNGKAGMGYSSINGETRNEIVNGVVYMRMNDYKAPPGSITRNVTHPPMRTFIHEMVHVAQIVTGNLYVDQNRPGDDVRWRGTWMELPAYEDMPWEHQADRLADQLFEPLRSFLKKKVEA